MEQELKDRIEALISEISDSRARIDLLEAGLSALEERVSAHETAYP